MLRLLTLVACNFESFVLSLTIVEQAHLPHDLYFDAMLADSVRAEWQIDWEVAVVEDLQTRLTVQDATVDCIHLVHLQIEAVIRYYSTC